MKNYVVVYTDMFEIRNSFIELQERFKGIGMTFQFGTIKGENNEDILEIVGIMTEDHE